MGFIEDMNAEWLEAKENRSVQSFRFAAHKLKGHAIGAKEEIDEIVAEGTFGTVAQSIKDEGLAVRALINDFVSAMAGHAQFLDWRPPE